jgi:hypothetical protein
MKSKPLCPTCKKNDMVFASHMFGKKDMACTRCKRTFRPMKRKTAAPPVSANDIVWSRSEFKTMSRRQVSHLLAIGHSITVR